MDFTGILILACIFVPLERLLPINKQATLRRDWFNDVIYVLVNSFVVRAGLTAVAGVLMMGVAYLVGPDPTPWVGALPMWVQVILIIVIADVGYYAAHRACHVVPVLWKFHAVHHGVEELDWLATHRVHPVDQVFSTAVSLLPVWCMGFSVEALLIQQAIYQGHALLVHSNLRLEFGPLKWLIASPEYHHWHHANEPDARDVNFAAQLSIIDAVMRTIFMPAKRQPKSYGLDEPIPRMYHQQLIYPLRGIARSIARDFSTPREEPHVSSSEKSSAFEDTLGKFAMLFIFGCFGYRQVLSLNYVITTREEIPLWWLVLCSQVVSTIFLVFILYFTLVRLPPRENAAGVMPRIVAIVGTFVMSVLIVIPPGAIPAGLRTVSTVMVLVGTLASIYSLLQLGRSFSIMATSRELKTKGAYSIVRHPLYATELLMMAGIIIGHGTPLAIGLGVLWVALQVRRAQYEEAILRHTFPEYEDYAARVPMLVPGLRLGSAKETEPKDGQ